MGFLREWFAGAGAVAPTGETSGTAAPEAWLTDLFGGMMTATGLRVSPALAMTVPGIAACVTVLSDDLSKVPLRLIRKKKGGGREHATDHPLARLIHARPAPWLASFFWRRAMMAAACQHGNGYSRVFRDGRGDVVRFQNIKPGRCVPKWTDEGEPFFDVQTASTRRMLSYQDVVHMPFRAEADAGREGGLLGVSPIQRNPEAIALSVATERFAAAFFRNGARPSVAVQVPTKIPDQDVANRLRATIERTYAGMDNAFKVAVLELGMTLKEFSYNPKDSQLMEIRKEQAVEHCRLYGVPPHKVGILDRATFSNIEHQAIDYVTGPLSTLAKAQESALTTACLTEAEQEEYIIEHDLNGLLRGDIKSRYEAYAIGRQWGWLNADQIAEWENLNPLPDSVGKTYLVPANMTTAEKVGQTPAPAAPPPADPAQPPQPRRPSSLVGPGGEALSF